MDIATPQFDDNNNFVILFEYYRAQKKILMKKLEGKISVITGAASGMGKEMALLFLAEGGKVVAADINQDRLNELKSEVEGKGGEVTTVIGTLTKNWVQKGVKA